MLGHNVFHVPLEKKTEDLPWFETDRGVRRLAWGLGAVLIAYWGWFLFYLADSMQESMLIAKVLVGLVPLVLLGGVAMRRPRVGGLLTVVLGVGAAAFAPIEIAPMLAALCLATGGLMLFSAHR
ncbi:MAG: hypothetical protein ACI89L_001865 [Phycisphaerales bacterium]|jgi:hypothetical protein